MSLDFVMSPFYVDDGNKSITIEEYEKSLTVPKAQEELRLALLGIRKYEGTVSKEYLIDCLFPKKGGGINVHHYLFGKPKLQRAIDFLIKEFDEETIKKWALLVAGSIQMFEIPT